MKPRADFSCKSCAKTANAPDFVIPNLPVEAKRCPYCGKARGFRRLFNMVHTANGRGRKVAKLTDHKLDAAFAQHGTVKESAKRYERVVKQDAERAYEQGTPKTREAVAAVANGSVKPVRMMPAGAALSSIPPDVRRDTANLIYPALTGRQVLPRWTR